MNNFDTKRLVVIFCLVWGGLLFFNYDASALSPNKVVETSSPQEVANGMANKAVRGVANLTTGWLELPKQIYLTYQEDGLAKGMTVGPLRGLGMMLVRTVAGAGETLTFFLAYPGFYDPYFEPQYVWQKE